MKIIITCLCLFLSISVFSQTPPPPGLPDPPLESTINKTEKMLLIAAFFLGIYVIKKRRTKHL